jgi:TolC family type I secretion outer membrane protein
MYGMANSQQSQRTTQELMCLPLIFMLLLFSAGKERAIAQCQGMVESVATAATCTARYTAPLSHTEIDPQKPYRLEDLIDIAESNNPLTRIAWETAKQAADRLGIARSDYYPRLAALALFGDQRLIDPFPEPLAPRGYVMVEIPVVEAGLGLEYNVFDFGKRGAKIEASKALRLAATAAFQRTNQDIAFRVVTAYYNLVTAQERLEASRQNLKTAQTTQEAAEAQLANGRATLPDVLNARAAAAQAAYDLESSVGAEGVGRVVLREVIGVEPSDAITIEAPATSPMPAEVIASTGKLVEMAMQHRPDLLAISEKLRAANAELKVAQADYRPSFHLQASAAQQKIWPSADYGVLGNANQTVWSVGMKFQWSLFDGGLRKNEVRLADSKRREAQDELREKQDAIGREVWTAYLQFRTAVRQHEAAETLFTSASTSYDASLDAYKYGVKNLVDLVTAEMQLAQARLAVVQSRSAIRVNAANLEYATGNLLQKLPPVVQPAAVNP